MNRMSSLVPMALKGEGTRDDTGMEKEEWELRDV